MKTMCLSENLVSTYEFTRRYNPQQRRRHVHHREKLKFPLCVISKKLCGWNLLHESGFMQLVSSVNDPPRVHQLLKDPKHHERGPNTPPATSLLITNGAPSPVLPSPPPATCTMSLLRTIAQWRTKERQYKQTVRCLIKTHSHSRSFASSIIVTAE
jgi:hypothetical protein